MLVRRSIKEVVFGAIGTALAPLAETSPRFAMPLQLVVDVVASRLY